MSDVAVNGRCSVHGTPGTIKFVGSTSFAAGVWIGVELDAELGKNDGSVQGTRYFDSKPNYGVFVRASQCKWIDSPATISAPRSSRY
jgi:dynactin 1